MVRSLILPGMILAVLACPPALAQRGPQGPTAVIVAAVEKQKFADPIEALGTTKSNESVVITADTAEKIAEIHFTDGQAVKAGDILITLDKTEEEAELAAAEALLAERKSAYDRAKGLQESSALSKATLQERLAAMRQAESDLELIKARIAKLAVAAPFDGVLGLREVSIGTLVSPGDVITTIDDLSQIKVDFDVPSVFLNSLKPGLAVSGQVEAFGKRIFRGQVAGISTQIDPVTRTVRVRAVIPNKDLLLRPGLLMTITLLRDQREALVIPEEALIKRGDKNFVFVADQADGKLTAREQEITIGSRRPGDIEVLGGLEQGDKIVTHGTLKLINGAEITIKAEEQGDTPVGDLLKQEARN